MATETKNTVDSAKFIFGKDGTVPITLEADGVKHTLDGTVWKGVNDAGDDVVIEGKRLTSALRKAGEGTKGVRLQPHAHDQLMTVAEDHGHLFTSSDNPFQHKLDVEPFREAYVHATSNPGELKELGGLMVGEEGAKAGQTPPHMKDLPKGVEDDFRRAQIRHDEKAFGRFREDITRGQKLQTEIAGINWQDAKFDKPGEAEKHLEAILAKHRHPEHGFDFVKQYGSTELDAKISAGTAHSGLEAAAEAFEGKVKTATTRLQAMAGDIKTLRTSITQNKKLFGDKDQLKADEAALEELGKEFDKYAGKSKAHAAAYAGLEAGDRAMLDSIASIKKSGATHSAGLATGATEAAKDAGKGSWFTHSAEELAKVAEKKGKSIEELGFFAKRTGWGKAAVIGVPVAVVGGVIAATGNKPGKYTQQAVNDNQLAQGAVVNR